MVLACVNASRIYLPKCRGGEGSETEGYSNGVVDKITCSGSGVWRACDACVCAFVDGVCCRGFPQKYLLETLPAWIITKLSINPKPTCRGVSAFSVAALAIFSLGRRKHC